MKDKTKTKAKPAKPRYAHSGFSNTVLGGFAKIMRPEKDDDKPNN